MNTKNFTLNEYVALLKLTDACKRNVYYRKNSDTSKSLLYVLFGLFVYYFALIWRGGDIFAIGSFENNATLLLLPLVLFAALIFMTYNVRKLLYVLNYRSSEWYKNTEYLPSEVIADKGVYGEYIANFYVQDWYHKNGLDVKIYNAVAIPKRYVSGKLVDFSEIDMIAVSDIGVEVFEIKNRDGLFFGASGAKNWTQRIGSQTHDTENPLMQNYRHCKALWDWAKKNTDNKIYFPSMVNMVLFVSDAEFDIKGEPVYTSGKKETDQWFGTLAHYEKHDLKGESADPKWVSSDKSQLIEMLDKLPKYDPDEMDDLMDQRRRHFESR